MYEINKENKNYEQAILYNDTALTCYDSIQKIIHHTEINNLIKKHSIIKNHKHAFVSFGLGILET